MPNSRGARYAAGVKTVPQLVDSFIPARWFTNVTTPAREIDVIVIHSMEAPEKGDTAEAIARFFQTLPPDRKASAHFCVDNNSIVQCVEMRDVAYAAPGCNHNGIQIEHAGFARQTQAQWLDEYGQAMLALSAELSAAICKRYQIPVTWLDPEELIQGKKGFTSHANVTHAFKKSDHTDPGVGFPHQQYLDQVRAILNPQPAVLRVDVTAGGTILKGQAWESPALQKRIEALIRANQKVEIRRSSG